MLLDEVYKKRMVNTTSILTLVFASLGTCMNFELKCPDSSQRISRAQIICNGTSTSKYYCLFDENRGIFVEQCKEEPDHVRPGEKYVITGRRRNVDCSSEKLQPYLFWSNASSDCVFIRSKCDEPGQVLYNNGTTKSDRSCRCDYTKGFNFITKPKDPCHCIPSKEDCSCYQTACAGNQKLTPDYECVKNDQDTFYSYCPPILNKRVRQNDPSIHIHTRFEERKYEFQDRTYIKYGLILFLFLILTSGLILIFRMICCENKSVPLSYLKEQTEDDVHNRLNDFKETVIESVKETVVETVKETVQNLDTKIQGEKNQASTVENRIENMKRVVFSQCDGNVSFVETRAFDAIVRTLHNKHYVIIKGNPGDGKTTLAYFAMRRLIDKQNKRPVQLYNYLEWNECVTPDENLIVFIDNLFGEYSVSDDTVTQWYQRFPMIKATVSDGHRSNYVIICIRNDIFNQCQEMVSNEFLNSAMVDISHGEEFELHPDEMKSIFCKYVPENEHLLSQGNLSKLLENVPKLGFPQCCRLYRDTIKLQKNGLDFFRNPLHFLKKELTARFRSHDMKMAVLVFVLLNGGRVQRSVLYDRTEKTDLKETSMKMCVVKCIDFTLFQEAISSIETSFIVHEKSEDMIIFTHSSVQSAMFLVVGKYNLQDLIQNCDYTLLSLITSSKFPVKDIESVTISKNSFPILMSRIRVLLTCPSSRVLKVISELYVWNDNMFVQKCQDFDELFADAIDEDNCSLFVHFAAVGCIKWVEHLCNKIVRPEQLTLALEVACGANKLDIVTFLLKQNVQANIQCCFNAVRGGHLEIVYTLAKTTDLDLTELCTTQSRYVITTTVLDEAALQNQCHLIEPLLKLCPELIHVKSSCNTTVIHSMAAAGNIELLKTFLAMKQFSPDDKSSLQSTILHFACQNNRFDTVQYIVETYPYLLFPEHYCFDAGTVLHTAAQSGNCKLFEYVHRKNKAILEDNNITFIQLDHGCHVYAADGQKQNVVEISKLLDIYNDDDMSILHQAAWSGSIKVFQYVAKERTEVLGMTVNDEIEDILQVAQTRNDNEEMIIFLQKTYCVGSKESQSEPYLYSS